MSPFQKGVSGNPAGARHKADDERRVRLSTTVAPSTIAWLRAEADIRYAAAPEGRRVGSGEVIDDLVATAADVSRRRRAKGP